MTREDILLAIEDAIERFTFKTECEAYVKGYLDALFELNKISCSEYNQLKLEARGLYYD